MNNQKFHRQHAPHIVIFAILLGITAVSGYIGFFSYSRMPSQTTPPEKEDAINEKNDTDLETKESAKTHKAETNTNETKTQTIPVELRIENQLFSQGIEQGETAYDLMERLAEDGRITFGGTNFGPGLGFFVEEINGKKEDQKQGWYWIYSINGEKAKTGISSYILQEGDTISWTYEQEHS